MQLTRNMTLCLYRNKKLDILVIQTFIFMVGYIKLCPQREVISQEGAKI